MWEATLSSSFLRFHEFNECTTRVKEKIATHSRTGDGTETYASRSSATWGMVTLRHRPANGIQHILTYKETHNWIACGLAVGLAIAFWRMKKKGGVNGMRANTIPTPPSKQESNKTSSSCGAMQAKKPHGTATEGDLTGSNLQ